MQRWSREKGGLGICVSRAGFVHVNFSCLEGKSSAVPGGRVSGGTSLAAGDVGEAAIKGRCGKREQIKATPLCASAMEAESLPFINSLAGVFIWVTGVFGREDSFGCLLIPKNKRKKGCQGNRHPERLTESSA